MTQREISSRDWFGKVCAGLICGYLLALGASGLFKYSVGAGPGLRDITGQVSIQLINIVWSPVVALCFLFSSTRSAWGWLGLANGVLWGALFLLGALA